MSNEDFAAWHEYHVQIFGMGPEDQAMVASWRSALDQYGLTELRAASVELLTSAPRFRNEHISGFFRILGNKRAQQTKAFAAQKDDGFSRSTCPLCRNTGRVVVPHSQCVRDGEFVHGPGGYKATMVVCCSCHAGSRWLNTFANSDRRPLTLASYQDTVTTGWREMLDEKTGEDKARSELQVAAQRADKKRGAMKGVAR